MVYKIAICSAKSMQEYSEIVKNISMTFGKGLFLYNYTGIAKTWCAPLEEQKFIKIVETKPLTETWESFFQNSEFYWAYNEGTLYFKNEKDCAIAKLIL